MESVLYDYTVIYCISPGIPQTRSANRKSDEGKILAIFGLLKVFIVQRDLTGVKTRLNQSVMMNYIVANFAF